MGKQQPRDRCGIATGVYGHSTFQGIADMQITDFKIVTLLQFDCRDPLLKQRGEQNKEVWVQRKRISRSVAY